MGLSSALDGRLGSTILVLVTAAFTLWGASAYVNAAHRPNIQCSTCLPPPYPGESLSIGFTPYSPTNATLYLGNVGSLTLTLVEYRIVDDKSGTQNLYPQSPGPTIPPGMHVDANITVSGFQLSPGNFYTITVTTARNSQFQVDINY